jgi:cyclophilin family peptidyl-prolyl cis-trans isomerase
MKQTIILIGIILLLGIGVFFLGTREATAPEDGEKIKGDKIMVNAKQWESPPEMQIDSAKIYSATIETSKGVIKADLFVKEAPNTVNNFVFLAREGFYDGIRFHRIIKDFMVQTGDPQGTGMGGPGYAFADEPVTRSYSKGTLAMANSGPDTNGSQFFIMTQDNETLPKDYTIFGMISSTDTESLATLDAIAATPVADGGQGEVSSPTEEVLMTKVTVEEK